MDYEIKHKIALENARQFSKHSLLEDSSNIVEYIFQELKESEDERMRKELICFLETEIPQCNARDKYIAWLEKQDEKEINDNDIAVLENWENAVKENKEKWQLNDWFVEATSLLVRKVEYMGQDIKNDSNKTMLNACINALRNVGHQHLANWLEKQGGHKPDDKAEPKFHKGEWIIHQGTENIYQVVAVIDNQYQLKYGDNYIIQKCSNVDRCARLWDITKDAKDGEILQLGEVTAIFKKFIGNEKCICYCSISEDGDFEIPIENGEDNVYGCTNTTPATREQCDLLFQKMKEAGYEWDVKNKNPRKIHNASEDYKIENIEHGKYYYCIKDYYSGGNKRASKGDVVQALRGMSMMVLGEDANEYFIPVNAIKQEKFLSDEDERICNNIIRDITINKLTCKYEVGKAIYDEQIEWLKQLKYRIGG